MEPKNYLKSIRKALSLTQVELAHKLGVSQGLITDIERGRIPISKKMYKKLEDEFGILQEQNGIGIGKNTKKMQDEIAGQLRKNNGKITFQGENVSRYEFFTYLLNEASKNVKDAVSLQAIMEEVSDPNMINFIRITNEMKDNYKVISDFKYSVSTAAGNVYLIDILLNTYLDSVLNMKFDYVDYEDFKKLYIERWEKLLKFKDVLIPLIECTEKFIESFKKFDSLGIIESPNTEIERKLFVRDLSQRLRKFQSKESDEDKKTN